MAGFRVEVVANGLRAPRSLVFDAEGGLLVVEQSHGISRLRLTGDGPCVRVDGDVQRVIEDASVSTAVMANPVMTGPAILYPNAASPLSNRDS